MFENGLFCSFEASTGFVLGLRSLGGLIST